MTRPSTPRPGVASEAVDGPRAEPALAGVRDDRLAERVLAAGLDRRRRGRGRSPRRSRAAAVTRATVGAPSVSVPVLSKTTVSTRPAVSSASPPRISTPASAPRPGADHDRGRRREAHGARAGDDQDRGEGREREGQLRLGPEHEPGHEREGRRDQHERHEDLAHPVGEALDRRLAALGLADELDDPGERRVAADARRPHHERAAGVQRAADDLVTRRPPRPAWARP